MSVFRRISASFGVVLVAALLTAQQAPAAVPFGERPIDRPSAHLDPGGRHADPVWRALHVSHSAPKATTLPGGRALIARAPAAALHECALDDSLLCGKVTVPLDRSHPASYGTVDVRFVVAPHTGPALAPKGAVFATSGGPGNSITGSNGEMYPFRDYVLAPLAKTYDMVFIDQRGAGRSDVIRCPAWQHHQMTYPRAAKCAHSLGSPHRRSLYSTAAVADDLDDVRQALGYHKIVAMGGSYAGNDMVTYAVRHRQHVASVVVASPYLPVGADDAGSTPKAVPGVIDRLCSRSVACGNTYPHPRAVLNWLVHRVRHHPVIGVGYDFEGHPHLVRVTESSLLWRVFLDTEFPFYPGQVVQAAAALRVGDPVPLLRLAATHLGTFPPDQGAVRDYSNGHNLARYCADNNFPWNGLAPRGVRHQQYEAWFAAEPARYGMFSKYAWGVPLPLGFFPDPCIAARWQRHTEYPSGTKVHGIPTLVLVGDLDLSVPARDSRRAAQVLTDSKFVKVHNAAHNPWFWRPCAATMVPRFIRSGQTRNLCKTEPIPHWWQVGSFPRVVAQAPQAHPRPGDHSRAIDRRLATVSVWALLDSIQQMFRSDTASGRGLRGGKIVANFASGPPFTDRFQLHRVRFTRDSAVTGKGVWDSENIIRGHFKVRGPGKVVGHLHFKGKWYGDNTRWIHVRGMVDGHRINVVVPAN